MDTGRTGTSPENNFLIISQEGDPTHSEIKNTS